MPAQERSTSNRVSLGCTVMTRACSSSSWDSDKSRQAKNLVEAMKLGSSEDLQAQGSRCWQQVLGQSEAQGALQHRKAGSLAGALASLCLIVNACLQSQ